MIKASELRIGNLVMDQHGDVVFVKKISDELLDLQFEDMTMGGIDISNCDPIPLNPEYLERLGFKKTMFVYPGDPKTEAVEAFIKDKYVIRWIDIGTYASFKTEYMPYPQSVNIVPGDMLYVHQLQNNYYYWTNGEELTIKEPAWS